MNEISKKELLSQYFTKPEVVDKLLEKLFSLVKLDRNANILEPSAGTKNFINELNKRGYNNIDSCEIDPEYTNNPQDYFEFKPSKKYKLIVGNPPFTQYNIKETYFWDPENSYFLPHEERDKPIRVENAFIYKSIQHLDTNGTIAFVLPISFFIANRNQKLKETIANLFSTIYVYQNENKWFDQSIPCCFAVFTNNAPKKYHHKIILEFDNSIKETEILSNSKINEEIIPNTYIFKAKQDLYAIGNPLYEFLSNEAVKYQTDYNNNNISAKNILEYTKIQSDDVKDYCLAVVRVGNGSVGKCGLINIKKDILNDMFFVFKFKSQVDNNKTIKERICNFINLNQNYFKEVTIRVGSKSIKKSDVLNFKITI
ncbi:MAG: hypothetical protein QXL94_06990 [Candidatus Parvarchaeum sp.]